ncbi:DUF4382 domain-containing protein [Vibrio furnissii]|uniref:DUF4382 domain-containing protein n=1 Tax=Vibrio furnissii TaxID=29494 RepID=UPI001EEB2B8E|nr:DUF4382 domain-containing protein [Vibrio furnissii]
MKTLPWMALSSAALLLVGCGGGDGDTSTQTSKVSFSVSDAPVDSASSVTVGFTQVELVQSDGSSIFLDVNPSDPSMDYEQIDLMAYQGSDAALIISDQSIPVGTYQNLILHVSTESNVNFVVDGDGTQALKQPSNKLRLGSFTVSNESTQAFTIEFDLRYAREQRVEQWLHSQTSWCFDSEQQRCRQLVWYGGPNPVYRRYGLHRGYWQLRVFV